MAKRPDRRVIRGGYLDASDINHNFQKIEEAFDQTLSRDGSTPNAMDTDLDVADATITNINVANVNETRLNGVDLVTALTDPSNVAVCFGGITLQAGDLLYWDEQAECLARLPVGSPGQMLKSLGPGNGLRWEDDIDTDTDTIGVNIYENGVLRGENVRTINWIADGAAGSWITGTPPSLSFDLVAGAGAGCFFEDTRIATDPVNGNIGGESTGFTNHTTLDLTTLGFTTLELAGNLGAEIEYGISYTLAGGPPGFENEGESLIQIRFRDNSGSQLAVDSRFFDGDAPTNDNYETVALPTGTRYIDTVYIITEGVSVSSNLTAMLRRICYV